MPKGEHRISAEGGCTCNHPKNVYKKSHKCVGLSFLPARIKSNIVSTGDILVHFI